MVPLSASSIATNYTRGAENEENIVNCLNKRLILGVKEKTRSYRRLLAVI